jgi:hypothetical protein
MNIDWYLLQSARTYFIGAGLCGDNDLTYSLKTPKAKPNRIVLLSSVITYQIYLLVCSTYRCMSRTNSIAYGIK